MIDLPKSFYEEVKSLEHKTILDATTEIVVAAVSNQEIYPDVQYAETISKFAEVIYQTLKKLEMTP